MPKGVPVGTVAIAETGAFNAGLLAASIISLSDKRIQKNLERWRKSQSLAVQKKPK